MLGAPITDEAAGKQQQQQKEEEDTNVTGVDLVEEDENDRNLTGGNRWPPDETLALIKIRSEMDALFRESNAKGSLWDDVSRKLAERGFNRSAKKCKEKFENIYKYHRRTKELGQRPNGKMYRFFEQLEAIDHYPLPLTSISPTTMERLSLWNQDNDGAMNVDPLSVCINAAVECPIQDLGNAANNNASYSWSKESDGMSKKGKNKRKFTEFFDKLMQEVTMKQEELQRRFVEAIERYEVERIAREEAWRAQETARIRREYELLMHERSISAAKDAAVIALLQKISQQEISVPVQFTETPIKFPKEKSLAEIDTMNINSDKSDTVLQNSSSSRWPRAEVEALISVRSTFDLHYQENSPKGPLWEEISTAMKKLGYDRSAKRCKEKWENINKYFKRVRDSNKKRPEDSRTCPYFHLLDNLYKQKAGNHTKQIDNDKINTVADSGRQMDSSNLLSTNHDLEHQQNELAKIVEKNMNPSPDERSDNEDEEDEDVENYQVVANNNNHSSTEVTEQS